ncbi:MBL fold metallo-hydrolase RNA specificity domain-containing protein [Limnohabitans sp. Rim28]|jgi:metallo-beta-lactamase family protein|uniref:MBL fold metallo-hydrolase RNA specificity domain-containing protein n=1 Tax=Limnohabitans sp. Rim28 TaxID=1100720 RepID=UPI0002E3E0CB|nr:MBL fold metallo-hydrolase [Limnohabitans sp. Rim28]PVE05237.1 MBL fold metallo-hydrolase [Limnohabitans sp. Rim28]
MSATITFLGGADTVTGSKYLIEHQQKRLLVDCGLFQGYKQLRLRNWNPLPVDAAQIDAVVLTHAHLDHSGYLPLLVKNGFRGRVHATAATCDLVGILLPDSGHIQEEDAFFANRHAFSKHAPALPLYTKQEAIQSLKHLRAEHMGPWFEPIRGWKARFQPAGHILGAASLLLDVGGRRILFSGDLGRPDDPLMNPPEPPPQADTVLIESTYGDRQHPKEKLFEELGPLLKKLAARGGVAVVPVFAVGRAQAVLHTIAQLKAAGEIPKSLPIFLDSPMAIHTTALFERHPGEHRLNAQEVRQMDHVATMLETPEQSKSLAHRHGPMVILAASGMATGGRVLHHLVRYAGDHRNLIVLTGYQAPGTRGAALASGRNTLRIHAQDVAVRAEVAQIESASAHADANQLLSWLHKMPCAPGQVYVVHGEREASDMLRQRIEHEIKWRALVPEQGSVWPL